MKIVCIADTHNKHNQLKDIPDGDMIIHCGDVSGMGRHHEVENFCHWYHKLNFKYKIIVAGNHDFFFENNSDMMISHQLPRVCVNPEIVSENTIVYIKDKIIEIEGIKIWGSPISPTFYNWAFMMDRGEEIAKHWEKIPKGMDIVITHGPAYGILDECSGGHVGCEDLEKRLKIVKPKYHLTGHIHESYGKIKKKNTTFINASVLDGNYVMINKPIVIEL